MGAYFNSNTREEMYPLYFTLDTPTDVYLGWQVDFTQGASAQEFRASQVKLVCLQSAQATLGDFNDDHEVNFSDLQILVGIVLGTLNNIEGYDLNNDGVVNVGDVTMLINLILQNQ